MNAVTHKIYTSLPYVENSHVPSNLPGQGSLKYLRFGGDIVPESYRQHHPNTHNRSVKLPRYSVEYAYKAYLK